MEKSSEQPSNRGNGFILFVYNCFSSFKDVIRSYNTYASNYDALQSQQYAVESNYNPFLVTSVTQDMEELVQEDVAPMKRLKTFAKNILDTITNSLIYGTFAFTNNVRSEKRNLKNYFVEKQSKKEMRGCGVDFFPFIERSPELKFKMDAARINILDSFLLKDKITDYTWGFVNNDLSVTFESTLLPLKPPKDLFKKKRI